MPQLRRITEKDLPFILDSWASAHLSNVISLLRKDKLKSNKRQTYWLPEQQHLAAQKALILHVLLPTSQVIIAVDGDDPSFILGYIIGNQEKRWLHWIYVKESFRQQGIGKQMFSTMFGEASPIYISTRTAHISHLLDKWSLIYNDNIFKESIINNSLRGQNTL